MVYRSSQQQEASCCSRYSSTFFTYSLLIPLMLTVLLLWQTVDVYAADTFPTPIDPHVNDFAYIFTEEQASFLKTGMTIIEENTTAQIVVVTIETTAPYTPSEYRTKLFAAWHIGQKDVSNGLLILYAVKEHRIEVEVGYGLEGILPDSRVGRILDETYVPQRDMGNVSDGILDATFALAQVVLDNADEVRSGTSSGADSGVDWVFVIVVFFIILVIILSTLSKGRSGGLIFVPSGGRGWSGGGGSGGFGGFGGGGSGGGGAGR